jgi:hypothetical protein
MVIEPARQATYRLANSFLGINSEPHKHLYGLGLRIKSIDNNFLSRGIDIESQSRLYVIPQGKISDKKIYNTTPNGRYKFWQKQKKDFFKITLGSIPQLNKL